MSKNSSASKKAGKIFAAFTVVILAAALAAAWFIGGQKRAAEKYFAAVASGNFKDMDKVITPLYLDGFDSDSFKAESRSAFEAMPQFSELESTDMITSRVRISESRMTDSFDRWLCTADVDFFSHGKSVTYKDLSFSVNFSGGKWTVDYRFDELFE